MSWTISAELIPGLARGAAVLGTGGGGDPYIGALLAAQALREHGDVTVVTLDEVPDDALVLTVAMMGAPTVMVEKLPSLTEVVAPVHALSASLGRPVTHIACAEVGGVNSTIPIAAAAALGLPLIDADGMGRAFPELQMVLPTLYGVDASPLAFSDEKGNTGVLTTVDNSWTERIARVACVEMGCSVMISGFPMSGAQAREALVADSLSLCRESATASRRPEPRRPTPWSGPCSCSAVASCSPARSSTSSARPPPGSPEVAHGSTVSTRASSCRSRTSTSWRRSTASPS
jgi:DUF917 family protein